jgi:hypothetical protein
MFPEEKYGSLEMPGEIYDIDHDEDVTDPPTVIMPERQYRTPPAQGEDDPFGDLLWPNW